LFLDFDKTKINSLPTIENPKLKIGDSIENTIFELEVKQTQKKKYYP
jgi:hypothetical protein